MGLRRRRVIVEQRKPKTDEQRERYNAYQREYRRRNPDKARAWRESYIMRKAARLCAEHGAVIGGDLNGGA